jgi:hypothetical protein
LATLLVTLLVLLVLLPRVVAVVVVVVVVVSAVTRGVVLVVLFVVVVVGVPQVMGDQVVYVRQVLVLALLKGARAGRGEQSAAVAAVGTAAR